MGYEVGQKVRVFNGRDEWTGEITDVRRHTLLIRYNGQTRIFEMRTGRTMAIKDCAWFTTADY